MNASIRKLLLQLLEREEHAQKARADAARYGFAFGISAAARLELVRAAIAWIGAQP